MQNDIPVLSVDPSVDGNDKDDLDVPQIALEEMIKELSLGEIWTFLHSTIGIHFFNLVFLFVWWAGLDHTFWYTIQLIEWELIEWDMNIMHF